jgi:hypothetical protein
LDNCSDATHNTCTCIYLANTQHLQTNGNVLSRIA